MKYVEFPSGLRVELKEITEAEMRDLLARGVRGIPAYYATVDGEVVYCPEISEKLKIVDE